MLKRILSALGAAVLLSAGLIFIAPTTSYADDGVYCTSDGKCFLTISSRPSDPPYAPDENGWSAGAPTCYRLTTENYALTSGFDPADIFVFEGGGTMREWYVLIECGSGSAYWSNVRQCVVTLVSGEWPARPAAYSPEAGYYSCGAPNDTATGPNWNGSYFWSETVPPGLTVYTPGRAAQKLIESFQLRGVDIGMAPQVNPVWGHRRTYVGVPVWLWVDNPQPLTWGPYTETATLGGQTITATAQVTSVTWTFGDGQSATCGTGTAYSAGYGVTDSPTCGHRYQTTSANQPGDRYTVTATSQWTVTWTSLAGPTGTVNLSLTSSDQLEVNELQSVNVDPNNGGDGS